MYKLKHMHAQPRKRHFIKYQWEVQMNIIIHNNAFKELFPKTICLICNRLLSFCLHSLSLFSQSVSINLFNSIESFEPKYYMQRLFLCIHKIRDDLQLKYMDGAHIVIDGAGNTKHRLSQRALFL